MKIMLFAKNMNDKAIVLLGDNGMGYEVYKTSPLGGSFLSSSERVANFINAIPEGYTYKSCNNLSPSEYASIKENMSGSFKVGFIPGSVVTIPAEQPDAPLGLAWFYDTLDLIGDSNQTGALNQYPYGQQQYSSCVVAATRNVLHMLGVDDAFIQSEAIMRRKIAKAINVNVDSFKAGNGERGGVPFQKVTQAINTILDDYGFVAINPTLSSIDELKTQIGQTCRGVFYAGVISGQAITANHMIAVCWGGREGRDSYMVDPGRIDPSTKLGALGKFNKSETKPIDLLTGFCGGKGFGPHWKSDRCYFIHQQTR